MGTAHSKCRVLYLPAQSGKTRKMEDLIEEAEKEYGTTTGQCNFIISDNNILLVEQTKTRVRKDLSVDKQVFSSSGIFSWTSSSKECDLSVGELAFDIIEDKIHTVVMCSHPSRFKYLNLLIETLSKSKHFSKKINIWIDEADKSIKMWSKYDSILEIKNVENVTLISATVDSIISKYKNIRVIPYAETHSKDYKCLKDSKRKIVVLTGDAVQDALRILDENTHLQFPGKKGFIPVQVKKEYHDELDACLRKRGFAVIVINGDRKELYVPAYKKKSSQIINLIPLIKTDSEGNPTELSLLVASLYIEYKLYRFSMVITGRLCLGRGITFQSNCNDRHSGFNFDYEILPEICNAPDAYQVASRGFGNTTRTKKLRIYTSSTMFSKIEKEENQALHIASNAHKLGWESIGKRELKMARGSGGNDVYLEEFDSIEELNERWKEINPHSSNVRRLNKNEDGKYTCALGDKSVVHTVQEVREQRYDLGTHGWGAGFEKAEKGEPVSRVYAGYDGDDVVFFLRWTIK